MGFPCSALTSGINCRGQQPLRCARHAPRARLYKCSTQIRDTGGHRLSEDIQKKCVVSRRRDSITSPHPDLGRCCRNSSLWPCVGYTAGGTRTPREAGAADQSRGMTIGGVPDVWALELPLISLLL